jgi:hypothetical protein
MYMLAFATLMVALTGVYAQVLALQTAHFYASQTTVINAMVAWHETAVAQATFTGTITTGGLSGCYLSRYGAPALLPACLVPPKGAVYVATAKPAVWALCTVATPNNCWTNLPNGYAKPPYIFYSVFYQPIVNGIQSNYVLTYVPPPQIGASNPAPGLIVLPGLPAPIGVPATGGTQIGITMSELMNQIKNAGLNPITYGIVQTIAGTNFLTSGTVGTGSVYYPLPTAGGVANIPAGSIGIISSP